MPTLERCPSCPPKNPKSRRERKAKTHEPVDDWFGPPVILGQYFNALGTLFGSLQQFGSVREVAEHRGAGGNRAHGFRALEDLTDHGRDVVSHAVDVDLLEGQLFRFRVTDKARLWCLASRETGEFEVLFWDPHHYLGAGHRYNDVPSGPEWGRKPFDDGGL